MSRVDGIFFVFAGLASAWLALLLLEESFELGWQLLLLVVFWLLVAYLVLPRIHRVLTHIYVPGYFIGRTRTSDGLLGDPVNLALRGDEAQVHAAMTAAGWTLADDVTLASSVRIVRTTLSRREYPRAPVSPLLLFDRQQDFAYQQEVNGNPAQRHHVRFWRCPPGWRLPGGHLVEWLAAGTYDRRVGLSLMTFQVTHHIASDIDTERDHIVTTLVQADPEVTVEWIRHFASGYHTRNGGGDEMETDGDLPVVVLRQVSAPAAPDAPAAVRRVRRPAAIVFGAGVTWLRALTSAVVLGLLLVDPEGATTMLGGASSSASTATAAALVLTLVAAVDAGLGVATYLGRNWARVLLMAWSATTILVAFLLTVNGAPRPTLGTDLPHVALGILVLLALTSPRARLYATAGAPGRTE